jgi:hypothetical protein
MESDGKLMLTAGNSISLKSGFEAEKGSNFSAEIKVFSYRQMNIDVSQWNNVFTPNGDGINDESNCENIGGKDNYDPVWVYKTKNDYSNKVPVELSEDNSKIPAYPDPNEVDRPIGLLEGYFLMGSFGPNTGYLSLTIEEYYKYEVSPGRDSLYKLLIDKKTSLHPQGGFLYKFCLNLSLDC